MVINTFAIRPSGRIRFYSRITSEEVNDLGDKLDIELVATIRKLGYVAIRWEATKLAETNFIGMLVEGTARRIDGGTTIF